LTIEDGAYRRNIVTTRRWFDQHRLRVGKSPLNVGDLTKNALASLCRGREELLNAFSVVCREVTAPKGARRRF